jgi:hypothetical protein
LNPFVYDALVRANQGKVVRPKPLRLQGPE